MSEEIAIESTGFMAKLSPEDVPLLIACGTVESLEKDEVLIRQDQEQDALYLLLAGTLEVERVSDVSRVKLAEFKPGEAIGEMSVIQPMRASATVRALTPSKIWSITRPKFDAFLAQHPSAGVQILKSIIIQMARRMRHSSEQLIHTWENRFGFDEDY